MKKIAIAIGLSLTALSLTTMAQEPDPKVVEARGIVKQFGGTLKGELEAAMKEGGPLKAINVCHSKAPDIAKQLSASSGWNVGRTSLKTRNVGNQPLPWEKTVLQEFESRKTAGEDVNAIEYSAVVEDGGKKVFRYMKAIPTGEVCLKCHGSAIAPEVAKELDHMYPSDKARGFAVGDIRGAFTLQKNL